MAGNEVDGGVFPALGGVHILRTDQPHGGGLSQPPVPLQVPAHVVPIAAVPLRPAVPGGERTHLIQSAGVPGLGNELYVSQNGVERQRLEQRRLFHGTAVLVPAQDGRKVEPEAVHPVVGHPIAQTVQNHLVDNGVVAVEGVAAAAEIVIIPLRGEQVVNIVVKALEGEEGAPPVALGGVVEHHIQIDLDAPPVGLLNEQLQLVALPVVLGAGGVAGVGGEEADGAVPPVVVQGLPLVLPVVLHLVELENGHQLNGVHAQILQIIQLFHQTREGPRIGHPGGLVPGEAPDVKLVDNQVLHGDQGRVHILPVEVVLYHAGLVVLAVGGFFAPLALTGHRLGVGV